MCLELESGLSVPVGSDVSCRLQCSLLLTGNAWLRSGLSALSVSPLLQEYRF